MKRFLLAFLFMAFGGVGFSQTAPGGPLRPLSPPPDDHDLPTATASDTSTPRPRTTSPDLAAKITATVPKYSPPKSPAVETPVELPDLRETDKPRNTIIRLPKFMVQGRRSPAFKEYDLLTPEGKLDLAYKRNPGLRFGSLPFFTNHGPALAMLADELRLERMAETNDLVSLYRYSDPASAASLKRIAQKTFMRTDDFGWSGSAIRGEDHGINSAALYSQR